MAKFGRNSPCHCGSGKKFKKCCINKPPEKPDTTELKDDMKKSVQSMKRSSLLMDMLPKLAEMDVAQQRRLEEHRHEEHLRSEFKKLGWSDERIDNMFPKGRGR